MNGVTGQRKLATASGSFEEDYQQLRWSGIQHPQAKGSPSADTSFPFQFAEDA
jgi:hypothetical protein